MAALMRDPVLAAAWGFGAGLAPRAPGTVGTLLALPVWWIFSGVGTLPYLLIVGCAAAVGVWVCGQAASRLDQHDPPGIVLDEVVGFMLALSAVPPAPGWLLTAFVLFRILDIAKPWPINALDRRITGGLGIMLDDLAAGALTALIVAAARQW